MKHYTIRLFLNYGISMFIVLFANIVQGQSIGQQVIGSAGNNVFTEEFDWTMGEMMITSFQNSEIITQGFHQGNLIITNVYAHPEPKFSIKVYPNPVINYLTVAIDDLQEVNYFLSNNQGQIIDFGIIDKDIYEIDMSSLSSGTYFIRLIKDKQTINHSKIIKIN